MALKQNNLLAQNGLTIPTAYIKIINYNGLKVPRFEIGVYNYTGDIDVETHTPTDKQVEIILEDGTTEMQIITEDVITTTKEKVLHLIERFDFILTLDLESPDNLFKQAYLYMKANIYPNSEDC